ncbi:hypothetical protein N3K66_006970 [Trichothecium roseum]|uniref:Uncharacterized protein n=1 Tax=Trichothecium roseum TaxID=47278 RepID=A0ACC0UWS7_9HYPO|nr:hypothetical protein N3K66_006970 [Trichothecium roseum]
MCERHQHHHDHHGHAHGHGHGHGHGDIAKHNQDHFNNVADTIWKEDWVKDLCRHITDQLRGNTEWIGIREGQAGDAGGAPRLLDYACGHGVVSRALAPHFSTVRGIDISAGMVSQYHAEAAKAGHPAEKMRAVVGDITAADPTGRNDAELDGPEWHGFGLAVISMALHHVADPAAAVQKLAERLAPGGTLLVLDFAAAGEKMEDEEDGDGDAGKESAGAESHGMPAPEAVEATISKHGFTRADMRAYFGAAGLMGGFAWKWFDGEAPFPEKYGGPRRLVMVKGSKALA